MPARREPVLLSAGSANTWFDLAELTNAMTQFPMLSLHLTGGLIPEHYPQAKSLLDALGELKNVTAHGWVDNARLNSIVQGSCCGVWVDRPGLEPVLGSRTRALFYAWHGLPSIASVNCELSEWLLSEGLLLEWSSNRLPELIEKSREIDSNRLRQLCHDTFNPELCYAPVMQCCATLCADKPRNIFISRELIKLKRQLRTSTDPTWRHLPSTPTDTHPSLTAWALRE